MKRFFYFVAAVLAGLWAVPEVQAQLVLPGAVAPTPAGSAPAAAAGAASAKKRGKKASGKGGGPESGGVASTRAPGEETVAGRQFQRNGASGVLALERPAKALEMSKLVLIGYQISKPAELCRVDISGGKINLTPGPRHEGLISYQVELEACPVSMDILEGAVRLRGRVCEFKAADCSADPSGVWGPPGASIGEAEAKAIEKLRGKADKDARAGFRAALQKAGGDKSQSTQIVRDQASFSSAREELCRDYAREDKHGFCASRVTLARAVALSAQLRGEGAANPDDAPQKPKPGKKPRPKRVDVAAPSTAPIFMAPAAR